MTLLQHTKEELNLEVQKKKDEIISHSAWHGDLTGVEAESLLRFQSSGTYLLRKGERDGLYYLSFVIGADLHHLPIKIDSTSLEWFYQNTVMHTASNLTAFIPEIMHREESECHPLMQFAKTKS